jgi:hypothetical protein
LSSLQKSSIQCSNCRILLPLDTFNKDALVTCPVCHTEMYAFAFPALLKPVMQSKPAELILLEDDAGCFYHSQKKAVVACEYCGRFLCGLCDIDFNSQHLCTSCIEAGKKKKSLKNLENRRVLYDDMALAFAILPLISFFFTVITAPIAIFLAIKHWNSPSSIIPRRSKTRMVFAIGIALMQVGGWITLAVFLISRIGD